MWRALAKGAGLAAVAQLPGGAAVYRRLTRELMGTQRGHVDKLRRAWPHYAELWQRSLPLEGARLWIHEGGWTAFPFVAGRLLTGRGVTVTNVEGRLLDRYTTHAVTSALDTPFPAGLVPGTLEHYPIDELQAFLAECYRILRPGGFASHVFDHRDHLHHADRRWPFLAHLALPDWLYQPLHGHALGYHNRLGPAQVVALFEATGFQRVAVRRLVLPDRRWIEEGEPLGGRPGLSRRRLAPRFRDLSDADLHTAAAQYLFRRPALRPL